MDHNETPTASREDRVVWHPSNTCIRVVARGEQECVVQIDNCGEWEDASLPVLDIETARAIADAYLKDGNRD